MRPPCWIDLVSRMCSGATMNGGFGGAGGGGVPSWSRSSRRGAPGESGAGTVSWAASVVPPRMRALKSGAMIFTGLLWP